MRSNRQRMLLQKPGMAPAQAARWTGYKKPEAPVPARAIIPTNQTRSVDRAKLRIIRRIQRVRRRCTVGPHSCAWLNPCAWMQERYRNIKCRARQETRPENPRQSSLIRSRAVGSRFNAQPIHSKVLRFFFQKRTASLANPLPHHFQRQPAIFRRLQRPRIRRQLRSHTVEPLRLAGK